MAEASSKGLANYLNLGFTKDPASYDGLAYGGTDKHIVLLASKDRKVNLHDLLNGYVANLGELGKKPEVKARLQKDIAARSNPIFSVKGL